MQKKNENMDFKNVYLTSAMTITELIMSSNEALDIIGKPVLD